MAAYYADRRILGDSPTEEHGDRALIAALVIVKGQR